MSLLRNLQDRARPRRVRARELAPAPEFTEGYLTRLVEASDAQPDTSRVAPGYIHVSSLLRFCPRLYRLAATDGITINDLPRPADRIMWALGRAAESHVRRAVIEQLGRERIYGLWQCLCGQVAIEGPYERRVCLHCQSPASNFGEAPVFDHDLRISGSPDLQLIEPGGRRVVEIKSMNKKDFDALTGPKPDHVFQCTSYIDLLRRSGVAVQDLGIIFYVCKDYAFRSPYKEFHVEAETMRMQIDAARASVALLRSAENGDGLPPKLAVCQSPASPTARQCPGCANCFARR